MPVLLNSARQRGGQGEEIVIASWFRGASFSPDAEGRVALVMTDAEDSDLAGPDFVEDCIRKSLQLCPAGSF